MAVARGEVIEKIYHASDKDRLKMIDDYVRSHDSVKGAGALMLLLTGNNPIMISRDTNPPYEKRYRVEKFPKIAEYVLPFSKDESLSPRVQWEVEKLLLLNKDGWKGSPEEWQMIKRWYTGKWKERDNVPWEASDEKLIVDYLDPMQGDRRANTLPEFLELAVAGVANDARSDRFKAALIQSLRGRPFMSGPAEAEKGFAFLAQTIRKDPTPARRVAAAKLLVAFIPFSAEQRGTLRGLQQLKLGDEATKLITSALEQK